MKLEPILIYVTTKNVKEAKKIGAFLVKNKLCACVNIINNMQSIYEWENKINVDKEAILIIKTVKTQQQKIIQEIKKIHSYSCPCIISFKIYDGNKDYLKWLTRNSMKTR